MELRNILEVHIAICIDFKNKKNVENQKELWAQFCFLKINTEKNNIATIQGHFM